MKHTELKLSNQKYGAGFTIVELLIVIVVIAILAAISIVAYNGIQERARTSANQYELAQIEREITTWALQENGESVSLGPLLARQEGASEVELTSALAGRPDITLYSVYDVTSTNSAYLVFVRLAPQGLTLRAGGASGTNVMSYRIDTSAESNVVGNQGSVRIPGSQVIGWVQVRDNASERTFAYNQAASHQTASLSPHEGWDFTGLQTIDHPSGSPVATLVFNAAHDTTTRTQVLGWLAETYDVPLTF